MFRLIAVVIGISEIIYFYFSEGLEIAFWMGAFVLVYLLYIWFADELSGVYAGMRENLQVIMYGYVARLLERWLKR